MALSNKIHEGVKSKTCNKHAAYNRLSIAIIHENEGSS